MTIGENIRYFRKRNKLTQKELAKKVGVNEVTIRSYESGKYTPKQGNLLKLAQVLNVNLYNLMDENGVELFGTFTDEEKEMLNNNVLATYAMPYSVFHTKVLKKAEAEENDLLSNYRKLNSDGRTEALKRVQELTEIPRYTDPEDNDS